MSAKERKQSRAGGFDGPVMMATDKPKNFKVAVKKLIKLLKPFRVPVIITLILAAISTVLTIAGPKILGEMINQIVNDMMARFADPSHAFDYGKLGMIALTLLGLYIISIVASYISGWVIAGVTQKIAKKLRKDISEKINRLPISYFDKHQFGDTLSRVTNDVDTIAQSINQSLSQLITSVTLVIGILVMMLTISWKLTLIALVVLPVSMFIIQFIVKKSQKYFKTAQDEIGNLNGHIEESLSGQTTLSVFSGEKQAALNFEKHNNALYASTWKSQFISGLMFPVMHFVSNLGYVATAIAGGYLVINQAISIGDLSAFIQYVNQFNQPLTQLSQVMNILQSAIAAGERVFNFLEEDEEKLISTMYSSSTLRDDFPGRSKILTPEKSSQAALAKSLCLSEHIVEFRDVNFSYDPKKPLIEGFNLKVKRGEKIAIVGPTGAGKTTIVNLLMRFYDPTAGEILIDGVRSVDMERGEVREKFGMVLQDTWLFDGTIEENLKYGKLGASKSELERAIKTAQIEHIVESLPNGLKTKIDEDSEIISAGEKQLLTIARAMVADPEMMILDEATSSVDTRTEILIQQAFDKLTKGRTSFIIAHRLSTIRNADKILVMKEGRIVESGGHMELLALNGAYAELYNSQFSEG